jgi:hypothetical protein
MQSEFVFTLPRGYVDASGAVHRDGVMRLATARDEIEPLRDADVRRNEAYLAVLLIARVVTRLGSLSEITPEVIEGLYAADFDHLQRLYERLNTDGEAVGAVTCPHCAETFEVDLTEIEDGRLGKCRGRLPSSCSRRRPGSRITSTGRWTRSSTSSTRIAGASSARRMRWPATSPQRLDRWTTHRRRNTALWPGESPRSAAACSGGMRG